MDNVGTTEFRDQQLKKTYILWKRFLRQKNLCQSRNWCLHLKIKPEVSKPICLVWTSRERQLSESLLEKKEGSWTFFKACSHFSETLRWTWVITRWEYGPPCCLWVIYTWYLGTKAHELVSWYTSAPKHDAVNFSHWCFDSQLFVK